MQPNQLAGRALVKRAFGQIGEQACRYLSESDRRELEALARVRIAGGGRKGQLNLLPFRRWMPGRLEGAQVKELVARAFSPQVVVSWAQMPRGEREDLQRLAVLKLAALAQGFGR